MAEPLALKRRNRRLVFRRLRTSFSRLRSSIARTIGARFLPATRVNIHAGRLPEPQANGVSYLQIPLNRL